MSKLNVAPTLATPVTHEGAPAKRIDAEAQLRRSVMSCLLWERQFYEGGEQIADRIQSLVAEVDPAKVAEIAIEARERMKLRHVPLLLARSLAKGPPEARKHVASLLAKIVQRPDELTEFLAIYWKDGRQPLSKQVKTGLATAFRKFSAYSLAKYNRASTVKLRDVLFLTHPKPKDDEQAAVWKSLVDGTLASPDTWEVALSSGADKQATWVRLLAEDKLGALALLRNLRNMQEAGVPEPVMKVALNAMRTERVLPFRFLAAARFAPTLEPELEQAMYRSLAGMEKLPGKTALVIDKSGSMEVPLSRKSDLSRFEAGSALAILLREICEDVVVIAFGTTPTIVPARRGFALRDALASSGVGGGTNTGKAKTLADKQGYDRIIIVTDEQSHETITNPLSKGYVINVASYQNGIGYGAWTHIDGWSEAVVDYILAAERKGES